MGWLNDQWNKLKDAWKDFWNGKTALNDIIAHSEGLMEEAKEVTEPGGTLHSVAKATPYSWDDAVVELFHNAASKALPYTEVAADVESCLEEDNSSVETVGCILAKVKENSDNDRARFYLKMGSALLRQTVFDVSGKWISTEKAEEFIQTEHDKRKEINKLLEGK